MTSAYQIKPSKPYPLGVRKEGHSIYVSMISETEECGILLYSDHMDYKEPLKIAFPAKQHIGQVYSMQIDGVPTHYNRYKLYQKDKVFADEFGRHFQKYEYGTLRSNSDMLGILDYKEFDWQKDTKPHLSFADSVIYGLHVRGFTMNAGSHCCHKGTYKGVTEKLDYLKELGVTSIALMPAYEFIEKELPQAAVGMKPDLLAVSKTSEQSLNYWGYKKGFYYAPKAAYSAGEDPCLEMKQLVKACHEKHMELIMQFYFPGDILENQIVPILEYWAEEYHIDGFWLLAGHININIIKNSPILADTKLIFRDFADAGEEQSQMSASGDKRLCIYREDTLKDYRRFIKGEEHTIESVMYHFRKNGRRVAYLNSIADYQGFRLADMVAYDYKHNEANGEHNLDGCNYNYSWNCGEEGPTDNDAIQKLRMRQMKNAMSLVLLSQGTPYIFMGDEIGHSQKGNNNPYNQDNDISWVNWQLLQTNRELFTFVKELISYRKAHPILHMEEAFSGNDFLGCGYPDLSFHGLEVYRPLTEPYRRELGIMLCGQYARRNGEEDKMIYIACNMHSVPHTFMLPLLEKELVWKPVICTASEHEATVSTTDEWKVSQSKCTSTLPYHISLPPRTIAVLEASFDEKTYSL